MFEKCNNCQQRVLVGHRTPKGVFCSHECAAFYECPRFCDTCLKDTLPIDVGWTSTVNGIGTYLGWAKNECPQCKSIVMHKFQCVFFIPIFSYGKFRVKYCAPNQFFSRKLPPYNKTDARELLRLAARYENSDIRVACSYYQLVVETFPGTSACEKANGSIQRLLSGHQQSK